MTGIRIALSHFGYDLDYWPRRVASGCVMLAVIAIQLHYLAEVNLGPKVLFDSRHVEAEPVSCQLDALRKALFQITNKRCVSRTGFFGH